VLENAKLFSNANIREHLLTCLDNSKLSKSQQSGSEQKLKTRDMKQSLYYKVGTKQDVGSLPVITEFWFLYIKYIESIQDVNKKCHMFFQESPVASPESKSRTDADATDTINTEYTSSSDSSNNLWLTILNCHQSQDPPRALINASRLYLRPILTILATCYEVLFHHD